MSSAIESASADPAPAPAGKPSLRDWTRVQIYVLVLLLLVNMSNYLDRGIIAILQEPLKQDLQLQDWQLGVISGPAFGLLYSLAGIPVVNVPVGFDKRGRPMGMQLLGPFGADRRVLQLAQACEDVTSFLGQRPALKDRV